MRDDLDAIQALTNDLDTATSMGDQFDIHSHVVGQSHDSLNDLQAVIVPNSPYRNRRYRPAAAVRG
jgi:hypothetical protein